MTKQARQAEALKDARAPTHTLFHIEERKDAKPFWTEIGAVGWENSDGSINIRTKTGVLLLPGHDYQLRARKERNGSTESNE
jgi:hypothetical protein